MRKDTKARDEFLTRWGGAFLAIFIIALLVVVVFLAARFLFWAADEYPLVRAIGALALVAALAAGVSTGRR